MGETDLSTNLKKALLKKNKKCEILNRNTFGIYGKKNPKVMNVAPAVVSNPFLHCLLLGNHNIPGCVSIRKKAAG